MTAPRILTVGCSDGYLEHWLLTQHPDAHIDGIELSRAAAKIADQRLTGTCKIGRAEDAPTLFPSGPGYDLVVAFEVIEHAPDVNAFLDALEWMTRPGGQVVISTPDGTFGEGGNPEHLRVYRAVDLADLLRRRGTLRDMEVGSDGVVVASYTPRPRLEDVAIYTGPGWEPWHPTDIVTRGLGGSETAAVRLAEELSALGFVVTVYADVREDTCYRDVIFRHWSRFDPLDSRAGLISSRIPAVADRPMAARWRALWVHDIDMGDQLTPRRLQQFDHVLCLSEWHERHLAGRYPWARQKLLRTRNGIHLPSFRPRPWEDRAPRVLYTSSPDRGLDHLLELWPRIRERVPDAELWYCYAEVYDRVADADPAVGQFRDRIRELADQPGVRSVGSLPQPQLAELMCDSRVWVHPSWASLLDGPFHETSCIGAMEAQAAGCVVVASDWGALPETVRYGRLVNSGGPASARWRDAFVSHIVEGLTDPEVGAAAVEHAPAAAAGLGWAGVAEQLAPLIAAADRGTGR